MIRATRWSAALPFLFAASTRLVSGSTFDITTANIADINQAFETGELTAERLVELCLARIEAFDASGPQLNAVLSVNPGALSRARELDEERRRVGPRSRLHGIPVLLKDNIDTADMPTTGGSFLFADSLPPDDAFLVKKLRDAGAIILAKTNMSELASGDARSSLGGVSRNPHDLERSPSGSSIGTAVGIAAAYAPLGLGTDTGGSIRLPAAANGIVGLRPTHGLLRLDGIIPLSSTFDVVGPMARSVYDVAAPLGVLTGRFETDYTEFLDAGALDGARIGVARQFFGQDRGVDWIMESSLEAMRAAGATFVDVEFPEWLLRSRVELYWTVRLPDFRREMTAYLRTLGPGYPKSIEEMVERAKKLIARSPDGHMPNASRWHLLSTEAEPDAHDDYAYRAVRDHGLPLIRAVMKGLFAEHELDAIVYPTSPTRPTRLDADPPPKLTGGSALNATLGVTPTNLASLAGFPDISIPAGFTSSGLPVGISFLGVALSEPRLLAIGYAFEEHTHAARLPAHAPPLEETR